MNISEELRGQAIDLGLCKEWTNNWKDQDLDSLCKMFIKGQDFAIEHDYPDNKFIIDNFGDVARQNGIFVDEQIDLHNPKTVILLGDTKGHIFLSAYSCSDIYVRHNSEVVITVKDHAITYIRLFNSCKVTINNESSGRVFVYRYEDMFNGELNVRGNGSVVVRDEIFKNL